MMRDLLLPEERKNLYIEFNVSGLLRGDQKSRFEAYAIACQWGWLSVNTFVGWKTCRRFPAVTAT